MQAATDIAPGAKACGKRKTATRTCTATIVVPLAAATYDIAIGDYNAKPVRGTFAKSAHLLAYGRLTGKKLSEKKINRFTAYLGGVVSGLLGNPGYLSLPGDGQAHAVALVIDPADFGNNPIKAGKKDPLANPIVVSVSETGGSGHAALSLNGAPGAASVTVAETSDTVELDYDGGGSIGYGMTVKLAAPPFKHAQGATQSITVSPLLLQSSNAEYTAAKLALSGNGDELTMTAGELGAPAGTTYTATASNCIAIASIAGFSQASSSSASFSVLARGVAATAADGCTLAVSDGSSTVDVVVTNTYSGSLGTQPTITEVPVPTASAEPIEITVGPDGAMWFVESNGGKLARATTTSASVQISEYSVPGAGDGTGDPAGIYAGPDGNLWWSAYAGSDTAIGKMTTAGAPTQYQTPALSGTGVQNITAGPDGTMWFVDTSRIGHIATDGTGVTLYSTGLSGSEPSGIALGPDGNLWFTEHGSALIGKITTDGTITEFTTPNASSFPWGITAGPDGNMWFAECGPYDAAGGAIGKIPTNATSGAQIVEYSTGMTGFNPTDITTGPDGALWYTYFNSKLIGRITTGGTITEYSVATSDPSPLLWGISAGPNDTLWFTACDPAANFIAVVSNPSNSLLRRKRR
ncbi:MAG TPA: hypothetical protein VMH02_04815 [Verrucomicrobiae bacterium]|nr:hypothetical protein [Verrucomicrobiae bacterium]